MKLRQYLNRKQRMIKRMLSERTPFVRIPPERIPLEQKIYVRIAPVIMLLVSLFLLTACGNNASSGEVSYKEMKSMVLDILKTEDGQKAISESASKSQNSQFKTLSTMDGNHLTMAVKNALTEEDYNKHLKKMMTDPKFAGDFAKAVQKENKQILKDLMKDPEYQALMIDTMKNKQFVGMLNEVLKSQEYRKQTMTIMKETMKSPIFKAEMLTLMQKALEEQLKPADEKKKDKGGGGGGGGS